MDRGDSGGGSAASDGGASQSAGSGTSAAETFPDAAATAEIPWRQSLLLVGVRPIVRSEGRLVLTLDLYLDGPDGDVTDTLAEDVANMWRDDVDDSDLAYADMRGVRLLDMEADEVSVAAIDAEDELVMIMTAPADESVESQRAASIQLAYGDLSTAGPALFIPGAPLMTGLPVTEGEVPTLEGSDRLLDVLTVDEAPVVPMLTRAFDLLSGLQEVNDGKASTVSIGSDVLFDSSSAELSADSEEVIALAAERILAHEPGEVTIIGHTDDVADDASNQKLSVQRAEAVAAALAEHVDPAKYPQVVEGRGESEPVAENDSDAGRAQNRRVELMISTPMRAGTGGEATRAPYDGPAATGEEGLVLENFDGRTVRVRAPGARIIEEHLVVTLEAVFEGNEVSEDGFGGFSEVPGFVLDQYDDDMELTFTLGGLGVLSGSLLTLPAMHRVVPGEDGFVRPISDLYTNARLDGGVVRSGEVVYPRGLGGIEPGGTVTLQVGDDIVRLTDIPIQD